VVKQGSRNLRSRMFSKCNNETTGDASQRSERRSASELRLPNQQIMEISRRDLYEKVWSTPLVRLARELDISDVGLKKACRRYGIPTPPRGYWAQLAAGSAPKRPALANAKIETVRLDAARHRVDAPVSVAAAVDPARIELSLSASTPKPSPVACATGEALAKARPTAAGFVSCTSSRVVSCLLSPATTDRAVRILAHVEQALPSVGGRLIHDRENKRVELDLEGERLTLSIEELTTRTEVVDKVDDKSVAPAWGASRKYVYAFSGDLRLCIGGRFHGRKSCADGKRSRLEDKLPSFLIGLVAAAHAQRQMRLDQEEQHRRWEEEARIHAIAQERRRRMKHFTEQLAKEAAARRAYCEVKEYVDHLSSQVTHNEVLPEASRKWLKLAANLAPLSGPARTRLELLGRGVDGHDWNLLFGPPACR